MNTRNLTILNVGKTFFLPNIPKSLIVKFNTKFKMKFLKYSNKLLLMPRDVNYTNYIHKRNKCSNDYSRHKYDPVVEKLVNDHINLEFTAAFAYLSMANYYGRPSVAYNGIYRFYMKMYREELGHAEQFMNYQNFRGGIICLQPVIPPKEIDYPKMSKSFALALKLEKKVKEMLQALQKTALDYEDSNCADILDKYIQQQEESIFEISQLFTRINELENSEVGKFIFDRELHQMYVKDNMKNNCVESECEKNNDIYLTRNFCLL